jgi:ferredoxin-nitrate reductase
MQTMGDELEVNSVKTGCPYCGVGCGLVADVRDGRLQAVRGDLDHPVNAGRVCAKPVALPDAIHSDDRATTPLWRDTRDERFRDIGWDDAIALMVERLSAIRAEHGPGSIGIYLSGQLLTEDYYVANKLAKGFLGTNHVDANSRLCMSSAVAGYNGAFGADGPPPGYADIDVADCLMLLGSNTAACHPILWMRIRAAQERGAKIIVVDPRRTDTAAAADLHLAVRPGTDVALLNSMLEVIGREGLLDRAYLAAHTEGIEAALAEAALWPPDRAAEVCGVPASDIVAAAREFAGAGGAMALWSMGANQSVQGTNINRGLINLCLAAGQIGRPGAGPLSLTGQPNAMGGREVGGLAHLLPGYRKIASAVDRDEMRRLWNLPDDAAGICPEPGMPATDLFDALEDGRLRAIWICGTNPVVSMPDAERTRAALRKADLVVCQDAYFPTETGALAHLILPAAQWPEKDGTMTNSERRVSLVRAAIEPPGQARPDWRIFAAVGAAMGFAEHFAWPSAAAVYDEFAAQTAGRPCDQAGISHARLRTEGSLQWPCPDESHPGTPRLYADGVFPTHDGRAQLDATPQVDGPDAPNEKFPLVLTTGRIASQWHTMTRTGKSPALMAAEPAPFVELHPDDARRAGVVEGDRVRLISRRGEVILAARIDATLPPGTAFAPFHWGALYAPPGSGTVNNLTHRETDPVSRQPGLKACAVRAERAGAQVHGRSTRGSRRRLVVVGGGPASLAVVESALAHAPNTAWQITIIGREPRPPYDRIGLSDVLAGVRRESELQLHDTRWYERNGIELRMGTEVRSIDAERRLVRITGDDAIPFDALVLATGSRPLLPPMPGLQHDGVHVLRTIDDVHAILRAARPSRRALVIGGGLLGLEAARALNQRGVAVSVVHLADRLMERQLDPGSARLLERAYGRLGIGVLLEHATTEVLGHEGRTTGLRFASGHEMETDLVVFAVGIRPEAELGRRAGLEIGAGIVVDDELRTSAPGIWAVGECAEHRGVAHGLWAPILAQARAAGASIAGVPTAIDVPAPATRLKVAGIELFCVGRPVADEGEDEVVSANTLTGTYRKLVLRGRQLVGVILLGDLSESARLAELARTGEPVPVGVLTDQREPDDPNPRGLVCACTGVPRELIVAAAQQGADSRGLITEATGAGSGCGSCHPAIEAILASVAQQKAAQTPSKGEVGAGRSSSV